MTITRREYISAQCWQISEKKHCSLCRIPGFARLSFWKECYWDEDHYGALVELYWPHETEVLERKSAPVSFYLPDWSGMESGTQVSINCSRYLAANTQVSINSSRYLAANTHRLHNKTKKWIFLQDRNILYSENNTKHINALFRQHAVLVLYELVHAGVRALEVVNKVV